MPVAFPIGNMHVPLDVPFLRLAAIDSNCGVYKIRAGFPIPKTELNDFY